MPDENLATSQDLTMQLVVLRLYGQKTRHPVPAEHGGTKPSSHVSMITPDPWAPALETIHRVAEMRRTRREAFLGNVRFLINKWKADRAELIKTNRSTSYLFNPLKKMGIGEMTHSRVIGDLLDPHGSHGQGSLFLHEFLRRIGIASHVSSVWRITIELGRVDICLRCTDPHSVVIIENKSNWAGDQSHQLYRYWFENIYKQYPGLDYQQDEIKDRFKVIYLTPSQNKRPAEHSLTIPAELSGIAALPEKLPLEVEPFTLTGDLSNWLVACSEALDEGNHRLGQFLKLYAELWH